MRDDKIVALLINQDEKALGAISEKYEKLLKYIASGILKDKFRDVEECVNDTYYKIWKNAHNYDFNKASLKTYLKVIVRNTALNKARDSKKNDQCTHREEYESLLENYADYCNNPERKAIEKEKIRLLEELMSDLDQKDNDLLLRRYFYLQSTKDIAKHTGMSTSAVDTRLSRLRFRLKDEFERRFQDE